LASLDVSDGEGDRNYLLTLLSFGVNRIGGKFFYFGIWKKKVD
jgi:hypothetical protein